MDEGEEDQKRMVGKPMQTRVSEAGKLPAQLLRKGLFAMQEENYEAALACFDQILALDPPDADLLKEAMRLRTSAQQYASLIPATMFDVNKRVVENKERGWAAFNARDYDRAIGYYELVLKDFPADEGTANLLNQAQKARGKPPRTIRIISKRAQRNRHRTLLTLLFLLIAAGLFGASELLSYTSFSSNAASFVASFVPPDGEATATTTPPPSQPQASAILTPTLTPPPSPTPTFIPSPTLTPSPSPFPTLSPTSTPLLTPTGTPSLTSTPQPTATTSPVRYSSAVVAGSSLNVRTGAGVDYPLEEEDFTLKAGDVVDVLSTAEGSGCEMAGNIWFEVRTSEGLEGWVCSYYVNTGEP
jgi:uncharacterized protein YgiM (DUF1202 family)